MNSSQWGIKNIMLVWTICIVIGLACNIGLIATGGVRFPAGVPVHGP
jgi:hypothetical protein